MKKPAVALFSAGVSALVCAAMFFGIRGIGCNPSSEMSYAALSRVGMELSGKEGPERLAAIQAFRSGLPALNDCALEAAYAQWLDASERNVHRSGEYKEQRRRADELAKTLPIPPGFKK